jgi:membrane protein implicated in regulation of membrane protease activity
MLIYAGIAAFGFLVLLVMLVAGDFLGGDHEIGGGDGGLDHGDAGGPSLFSLRIMSSFLTAFGVGGVVARYYGLSHPAAAGVGTVAGAVMSTIVYQFARLLYSQQASSDLRMSQLVGLTAEVTVAIPDGGVGQVTLTHGGERSEHIARSGDGTVLPRGASVVITGLGGDSVTVARAVVTPGEKR